jgi:hypothetical protein
MHINRSHRSITSIIRAIKEYYYYIFLLSCARGSLCLLSVASSGRWHERERTRKPRKVSRSPGRGFRCSEAVWVGTLWWDIVTTRLLVYRYDICVSSWLYTETDICIYIYINVSIYVYVYILLYTLIFMMPVCVYGVFKINIHIYIYTH